MTFKEDRVRVEAHIAELVEQGQYPESLRRAMRPVDPRLPEDDENDFESSAERAGPIETASTEPLRPSNEPIGNSHVPDDPDVADNPDVPEPDDEPDTQDWIG